MLIDIIHSIKETASTLKKLEILEANKDNKELKAYFFYCLNSKKFGIKKIPDANAPEWDSQDCGCVYTICLLLDMLSSRKITGNKAIEEVARMRYKLDKGLDEIFINMLQKNPRCGVSIALVNRVWENLIPVEAKLCKAEPFSKKSFENIVYPAFSQRKCDGARCIAVFIDGEVTFYTSKGLVYNRLDSLAEEVKNFYDGTTNFVVDGELLISSDDEGVCSRKTGNGILNKSIKNTISEKEAESVRFVVWDYIPYEEYMNDSPSKTYKQNFEYLQSCFSHKEMKRISLVETKVVNNKKEAIEHFKEMLIRGEEGTILKNMNMLWEGKRSKNCVKFKVVIQTTMKVVDILEGTEKYTEKLGAVICESEDGKVVVKCGSGFDDEQREEFFNKDFIGHYIEVASNGIIQAEDGTYSLFLPRFKEDRTFEKTEADTFDTILALSDGSGMLNEEI